MAIRYKALTELYQETQRKVTAPAEWQQFLTSACRNYRLSFDEQLLVYAQRPDAKASHSYDVLEMSGSRAVWKEVLAVYAVKTTTDPDAAQEVATMDDTKKQLLKDIFWKMNEISSNTDTKTETVIETSDDGNGNIVETETTVTQTYLYITVSHKTAEEMADQFGFNEDQREQMAELLADENNSLWSQVLYGISGGDGEIVTVALSQVGNVGGEPYWSWYGFNSRVEWCACFVSWCANECGYKPAYISSKDYKTALDSQIRSRDQKIILSAVSVQPEASQTTAEVERHDTYIKQLELIDVDESDIFEAASDFLRTRSEKTAWAKKGLINGGSFTDYYDSLKRLWKNQKLLSSVVVNGDIERGKYLYAQCLSYAISHRLLGRDVPSFFGSGSLQALANEPSDRPTIGWHPRYIELLKGDDKGDK